MSTIRAVILTMTVTLAMVQNVRSSPLKHVYNTNSRRVSDVQRLLSSDRTPEYRQGPPDPGERTPMDRLGVLPQLRQSIGLAVHGLILMKLTGLLVDLLRPPRRSVRETAGVYPGLSVGFVVWVGVWFREW